MQTLRAAVIGAGYLGRFHAQKYAALPDVKLVAVCDSGADVVARVAAELGCASCGDYRELLGNVEVVSVVTPTPSHFEIAAAFLRAGAHVLVEKPITTTVAEAQQLIALAAAQARVLQVGHLERFNPAILAVEEYLKAPRFIECHRLAPFKQRGTDVNVVLDLMIHDIDIIQSIVGAEIVAMEAVGAVVFSTQIDIANARIRFANGCVANATASRVSMKSERKLRIFLDDTYLSLDLQQKILTSIRKKPGVSADNELPVSINEIAFEQGDALRAEIEAFLAACRGTRAVAVSGEDGLRALQTAISITEMLMAGRT
jgi:predicted dehydrogenase